MTCCLHHRRHARAILSPSEGNSLDKSSRLSSNSASAQPDRQTLSLVTAVAPFHHDVQATSISLKPSGYVQPNAISYLPTSDAEVIDLMLPVIQLSSSSQTLQRPISLLSSPKHESNKPQASSYQTAPSPQSLLELTETSQAQVVLPPSHPLSLQSPTVNVTSQTPTIGLVLLQPQFTDSLPGPSFPTATVSCRKPNS